MGSPTTACPAWPFPREVEALFPFGKNDGDSKVSLSNVPPEQAIVQRERYHFTLPRTGSSEPEPQLGSPHPAALPATDLPSDAPSKQLANTYPLGTEQPWWTFCHTEEKMAAPAQLLCHPRKTEGHSKQKNRLSCPDFYLATSATT